MNIESIADIQFLIDNSVEESTELEYKRSFAKANPKWKEELAKDISAMANANGGIFIYGLAEKNVSNGLSLPELITPIPSTEMTKDQLSQLLFFIVLYALGYLTLSYSHKIRLTRAPTAINTDDTTLCVVQNNINYSLGNSPMRLTCKPVVIAWSSADYPWEFYLFLIFLYHIHHVLS